ncbi:MAG: Crp/Fnr family transcriptional regulator [Pseudomonadota bacterium]
MDDEIAFLARVPFFAGFNAEHLRLLAFGAEKRRLAAGEYLFHEGDLADGAYILLRGELAILAPDDVDRGSGSNTRRSDQVVHRHQAGAIVEPMTLISLSKRQHDAVCSGDSEVLRISRALFIRMLGEYPGLAVMLRDRVGNELAGFVGKLDGVLQRMEAIED